MSSFSASGMLGRNCVLLLLLSISCTVTVICGQQVVTGGLRLVNSSSTFATAGRLEIYLNGRWGTVCDDGFGREEATLACNQLGYANYETFGTVGELRYPTAFSSPILVSDLACDSNHLTIYHCPRTSGNFCSHSEDIALVCTRRYSTVSSSVRFVSKRGKVSGYLTAGRVEIFYAGRWGTICSNGFTLSDAQGLCHILTGSDLVLAYGTVGSDNLEFDQGYTDGVVWVENFHCSYHSLDERYYCSHNGIGITANCTHRNDLALSCLADGATRLVTIPFPSNTDPGGTAGRLEIYYGGQWGTVCGDGFNVIDADVVCNQLGYGRADRYGHVGDFGYTTVARRIWLDDVRCNLSSVFLANCSHNGFGIENCVNSDDVAISCSLSEHDEGNLRFVNHTYIYSTAGRLEIYLNGHWGTVCSTGFGPDDAILACNQLGYATYRRYGTVRELGYPQAAVSTPILVSNLACDTSNFSHLTIYHCPRIAGTACSHNQDVALLCSSPYSTSSSVVRFVSKYETMSSSSLTAGRVAIFFAGRWGSICSNGFKLPDAMGLCHILTGSTTVLAYGAIGSDNLGFNKASNSTPVWVQNFHCMYHPIDQRYYCDWDGLGITNCTHNQDLALSCQANGALRLISGSPLSSTDPGGSAGRLEIYYNGEWGTVCNSGFDQTDADVVCHQLGYERAVRYGSVGNLGYIQGTGTIWLDDVRCTSNDVFLAECTHNGFSTVSSSCDHRNDVAVSCTQEKSDSSSISTAAISGISVSITVVVTILCIVVISIIIWKCCWSKKSQNVGVHVSATSTNVTPAGSEKPHYEVAAQNVDVYPGEQPPSYYPTVHQQYPYQHPGQQYEMQHFEYSQYPQYPPPPHPSTAYPGYGAESVYPVQPY